MAVIITTTVKDRNGSSAPLGDVSREKILMSSQSLLELLNFVKLNCFLNVEL